MLSATPGPVTGSLTYVSFSSCCSSQWICFKVFHRSSGILSQITSRQRHLLLEETLHASRFQWRGPEQDREARFETKEVKTDSSLLIFGDVQGYLLSYVCLFFEFPMLLRDFVLELALWLSCKPKLLPFILTPCLLADQHVPAGPIELMPLLYYTSLWIRSLHHLWPSNRNPAFWNHIAKVFFFVLQEFMNNQQGNSRSRDILNFPEAFHQSLFDLQALTSIFMDNSLEEHYILGARIMTLTATASTEEENTLLQFCPSTFT